MGTARAPVSGSGVPPACSALVRKPHVRSVIPLILSWSASGCGTGPAPGSAHRPNGVVPRSARRSLPMRESNVSSIDCGGASALSLPDRTVPGSAVDVGAYVRVLSGGVQRCPARPRYRVQVGGEAVSDRGAAAGDHTGQDPRRAWLVGRGRVGGVGAVGAGRTLRLTEFLRLAGEAP